MINLKKSLDRYLTEPPHDGFDNWVEDILENQITDDFYAANEDWLYDYHGVFDRWLNLLCNRGKSPNEAAQIIERAHKLFKL